MSLESKAISSFIELRQSAKCKGPKRVAVVIANDKIALTASDGALTLGIAHPVLIGDLVSIRSMAEQLNLDALLAKAEFVEASDPAAVAVQMAREGSVDVLLKGHLRTDELLKAVLQKEIGFLSTRKFAKRCATLRRLPCRQAPVGRRYRWRTQRLAEP